MADADEVYELMVPGDPYTAREIGDLVGETTESGRIVLEELHEEGRIEKKQHSKRAVSYWIDDSDDHSQDANADADSDSDALTATSD